MSDFNVHRYLDEAGDTTFYGKGKIPIIGNLGVSTHFFLGMLSLNEPTESVRKRIIDLQEEVGRDPYFNCVPSISKKKNQGGFFLHAKDDVPEVRKMAFEMIMRTKCHFKAVIVKKDYQLYEEKYNQSQSDLYGELLSQLLIGEVFEHKKLVLNIAQRSNCTTHKNLEKGLNKVALIASKMYPTTENFCKFMLNVQKPTTEPIINITDYFLWAVQRKWERNEDRYFNYLSTKIKKAHFHT